MVKSVFFLLLLVLSTAQAAPKGSVIRDFDPYSPDAMKQIEEMDKAYFEETGLSPMVNSFFELDSDQPDCRRMDCHVFIDVERSKQVLNLYIDGKLVLTTRTSTGKPGHVTPNFDTNPNGRIYQVYSSSKYPGYNNMPFAIFISGPFAIHGAPGREDAQLGQPVSHGCVRVRTSVAEQINKIVKQAIREAGGSTKSVWITVRS